MVTPVCRHFGVTKQPHGVRDSSLTESDSGCRPEAMIKPSPPAMGHVMVSTKPTGDERLGTELILQGRKSKRAPGFLQCVVLSEQNMKVLFRPPTHARRKASLGEGTFLSILAKVHISEPAQFKVIGQRVLIKIQRIALKVH